MTNVNKETNLNDNILQENEIPKIENIDENAIEVKEKGGELLL